MHPLLKHEEKTMNCSFLNSPDPIPSLCAGENVQQTSESLLSEEEGLFIGYGYRKTSFPYNQQSDYSREFKEISMAVAVLENDHLRAEFLPQWGGRLWSLTDKLKGKNLLHANKHIAIRNLAVRNAWFSGGAEWNIGMIGHSPFTCSSLYTANITRDDGIPVLRMYEFERLRGVVFQMDFWLEEDSNVLFCRIRIDNRKNEVIPIYWWTNIAVPEHSGGRVLVPADSAYTNNGKHIYKVQIPYVEDIDISKYGSIPRPVDYFFDIPREQKKFIANIDQTGYGLLHMSSDQLQGRKLFSWGHTEASNNWQETLNSDESRYVEIQAGLAKTQYECIPMPPNTALEWTEGFMPIKVDKSCANGDFETGVDLINKKVEKIWAVHDFNKITKENKSLAKKFTKELVHTGSGFGFLENQLRKSEKLPSLGEHLIFVKQDEIKQWSHFLKKGDFAKISSDQIPESYVFGQRWRFRLIDAVKNSCRNNWYAWYHLGVIRYAEENYELSISCLKKSIRLSRNVWNLHALSMISHASNQKTKVKIACDAAQESVRYPHHVCRSIYRDIMTLLLQQRKFKQIIKLYQLAPEPVQKNHRIQLYLAFAYAETKKIKKAEEILYENGGLQLHDIREGEVSLSELWKLIFTQRHPNKKLPQVPKQFNYNTQG